jgi:hypothetical protein
LRRFVGAKVAKSCTKGRNGFRPYPYSFFEAEPFVRARAEQRNALGPLAAIIAHEIGEPAFMAWFSSAMIESDAPG